MDLSGFRIAEEPCYEPSGQEVVIMEAAFRQRLPAMLKSPTGCGKTWFVEPLAYGLLGRSSPCPATRT